MLAKLFSAWVALSGVTKVSIISLTLTSLTGFVGWKVTASFASAADWIIPGGMNLSEMARFTTGSGSMKNGPTFIRGGTAGFHNLGRQNAAATTHFLAQVSQLTNIQSSTTVRVVFFR